MATQVTVYVDPGKKKGRRVAEAFADGCGGRVSVHNGPCTGDAAFWGISSPLKVALDAVRNRGAGWYYLDNCYLGPRDQHFRVTMSGYQFVEAGCPDWPRYERLGITPRPWKREGGHVLVCPPADPFAALIGVDHAHWLETVLEQLARSTDREIRARHKPSGHFALQAHPLEDDLRGAWALVTYSSNAAVAALLAGVPVFVTGPSAVACLGRSDASLIEDPLYPDREPRLAVLAAQQWTIDELRSGACWYDLHAYETGRHGTW